MASQKNKKNKKNRKTTRKSITAKITVKSKLKKGRKKTKKIVILDRPKINPIISPREENSWEAWQTFNPGVILLDNKIYFLYRAIGSDGISRLGYAVSDNGFTINERLDYPVYQHQLRHYSFNIYSYLSGGGWGGCEDPRLTLIGDIIYMLYVALDQGLPQLVLTSIKKEDFLKRDWKWNKPKNISPPGVIIKSGCLFPEKIKGKYVILYRIFPDIWFDFVDDLDFKNGKYLNGKPYIKIQKNSWDSRKIGSGAPPIKTEYGWLLIYYGVDERDASKYKMGAMILDLDDPTKVIYRSRQPILEPDEWYENEGHKAGIIYPCGAVVKDENLLIYYGGADSYVCVAYANLEEFLQALAKEIKPILKLKTLKKKK